VGNDQTTAVVQRYLGELAALRGDSPAEPIVRELLPGSVHRLQLQALCGALLHRSYPRLTRPPVQRRAKDRALRSPLVRRRR
jgi:RNA polymerase sigma-70 factor (ECF subfamily)